MGYNSVAIILNDSLHAMEKDTAFGQRVSEAVRGWYSRDRDRYATSADAMFSTENGGSCCHGSALTVISQDHADGEQVVIVHGNTGQRCQDANDLGWHALSVMKEALERHGYTVTKKRKPK